MAKTTRRRDVMAKAAPEIDGGPPEKELQALAAKSRQASELLKALSHESRLVLLCILAEGEKSVGELEAFFKVRQSTVSQRLARLRLDRLVTTRRDGNTVYYALASPAVRIVLTALYEVYCEPIRHGRLSAPEKLKAVADRAAKSPAKRSRPSPTSVRG